MISKALLGSCYLLQIVTSSLLGGYYGFLGFHEGVAIGVSVCYGALSFVINVFRLLCEENVRFKSHLNMNHSSQGNNSGVFFSHFGTEGAKPHADFHLAKSYAVIGR